MSNEILNNNEVETVLEKVNEYVASDHLRVLCANVDTLKEYSSLQDNPYNVRCIHTVLIVHNYFAPRGVVNVLISESSYCTAVH